MCAGEGSFDSFSPAFLTGFRRSRGFRVRAHARLRLSQSLTESDHVRTVCDQRQRAHDRSYATFLQVRVVFLIGQRAPTRAVMCGKVRTAAVLWVGVGWRLLLGERTPLDRYLNHRRVEMGLTWEELAHRARTTPGHLRKVRAGHRPSPQLASRIEQAVDWAPGSIRDILAGGRPTPRSPEVVGQLVMPVELVDAGDGSTITVPVPPDLSEQGRQWVIARAQELARQLAELEGSPHTRHTTDNSRNR